MNTNQIATTQALYIPGTVLIVIWITENHLFWLSALPALFPLLHRLVSVLDTFIKKYIFTPGVLLNVARYECQGKLLSSIHVGNHVRQCYRVICANHLG